jgi:hypothetical protein
MKSDRLILIHKIHLDVGFAALAENVLSQYVRTAMAHAPSLEKAVSARRKLRTPPKIFRFPSR